VPGRPGDIRTAPETEGALVAALEEARLQWGVMIDDVGALMEAELVGGEEDGDGSRLYCQ
jgi:hypothetical protein